MKRTIINIKASYERKAEARRVIKKAGFDSFAGFFWYCIDQVSGKNKLINEKLKGE